jgi:phosphate transport system permease protein
MSERIPWNEFVVTRLIQLAGYSSILFVTLILAFLLREGMPALWEVPIQNLFSARWYPIENLFGILPLIYGTLLVTFGAALVAVPIGIGTAVYISEVAPQWAKEVLKPLVEILAGLPSVVLGVVGILVLSPNLRILLNLPTGLTALAGALLLGAIAIPTIVSISEDALNTVPRSYREASLALGSTHWQTIWQTTVPAARSGIITAVMLGLGRALGETMAVMMVTGNAPEMPATLNALFMPVRTMTATIASEMGEVATGSTYYHVLFFVGMVLFLFSLVVNVAASSISYRKKGRSERLLS